MPFWGGPDRRKSVRIQLRVTVRVELQAQPRFYEAMSRDLSLTGARLVLRQQLGHCTPITLQFRLPGSLNTLYVPAHVAWSKDTMTSLDPKVPPSFEMGVEFVSPARVVRKEIEAFVAERLKAAPKSAAP